MTLENTSTSNTLNRKTFSFFTFFRQFPPSFFVVVKGIGSIKISISSPYTFKALCQKVQLLEDLMEVMKTISQKSIIYDFFKVIEVLKSSSLEVIMPGSHQVLKLSSLEEFKF